MAERGSVAVFILDLEVRSELTPSSPGRFVLGKVPRYCLNRVVGGPRRRSGRFGEEKNLLLPRYESLTV